MYILFHFPLKNVVATAHTFESNKETKHQFTQELNGEFEVHIPNTTSLNIFQEILL